MKKVIVGLVLIITIALSAGIYYVFTNLDSLVEAAIEKYGSEATQTSVLVDSVKINLTDGAAGIKGLSIGNPNGYDQPNAFSLGEIRVAIDLQSLQEEPYIIDEITVLAPQVFVEMNKANKTNLNELKKNLTSGSTVTANDKKPKAEKAAEGGSAKEPRLIIRRLTFADGNIEARVAALDNKEMHLKLPSLHMTNLGGSKGATATELANEILNRLTDQALKVVKKDIIDGELKKIKGKAQKRLDEEKAKLEEKAGSQVKDKLKGLF